MRVVSAESVNNSQSLVLSLIGIAISVWVGLNIYNVISKEELNALLVEAEKAANATAAIYTESLKSKFRLSFSDRTANYFITQLDTMDRLPTSVLEKILELEDIFNFSYKLYCDGLSTRFNQIGEDKANKLLAYAEKQKSIGCINKEQYSFILGYCALHIGDFLYFRAQYDPLLAEKGHENDLLNLIDTAAQKYRDALYYLFRIRDIRHCGNPETYSAEERISLAILGNNIGSIYLLNRLVREGLNKEQLEEIIEAEKVAADFSTEISALYRSVYIRNLGIAYERNGQKKEAYEQYCRAFSLNHKSWKAAHCIASWYGKEIRAQFPDFPAEDTLEFEKKALEEYREKLNSYVMHVKGDKKKALVELVSKSTYWSEIKVSNCDQLIDKWLVIRYLQLYVLTKKNIYYQKVQDGINQLDYQNRIMTTEGRRRELQQYCDKA